jgi:biotin carboxyl carrier protein
MRVEIELEKKAHSVELTRVDGRLRFALDGETLDADAIEVEPGIYSILIGGNSFEVRVELRGEVGGQLRVVAGDREFSAIIRDPRQWRGHRGTAAEAEGRQQVVAPMPGKIVRVLVKAGDAVEIRQGLLVVEAMKMQNEIRSPKSGVVERLLVNEGQTVNAGEILAIVA